MKFGCYMKCGLKPFAMLVALGLAGCGVHDPQRNSGIEGKYVDDAKSSANSLTITSNTWRLEADGIVFMDCTYTAQKRPDNRHAVEVTFMKSADTKLVGEKATYLVRRDGEFLFIKHESEGDSSETKFRRK